MMNKTNSLLDKWIMRFDKKLRSFNQKPGSARPYPAAHIAEAKLTEKETRQIAGFMRVNHAGEICAQALYLGQALTARNPTVKHKMQIAAQEEIDHLNWCQIRLTELNSHISYLTPLWFVGSLTIGTIAGLIGDKWNLGFVAETENQVVKHLENHLKKLPNEDLRSQKIIITMRDDEAQHARMAIDAGAAHLPLLIKKAMTVTSKLMTTTAYWI